jgi:hypothetical protein
MVDDAARDRAIYHALKAADEVAAALQAHLIEVHRADRPAEEKGSAAPSPGAADFIREPLCRGSVV